MTAVNPDTIEAEMEAAPIEELVQIVRAEADALADYLPEALALQWLPTPRERKPSAGRSGNDGPANPTADIALDGQRLALRAQIIRSERLLRDAAIALRGVRLGLERTLERIDER